MGASSTKHDTTANEERLTTYARRKSLRNSLRSMKGSTKDIFSSSDKYLESLNDDFENGIIYRKKLEELRMIESEVDAILRDLQNFGKINNSGKRFELENSAKYLRNKLKSTMDTHMGNAIRKLNNAPTDNYEIDTTAKQTHSLTNMAQTNDVQIVSDTEQVAAKLRETSIKLRGLFSLLSSMYVIDPITEDSAVRVLNKCKSDLYHMQPKSEKHLLKRNKCFRTIDEIRTILLRRKLGNISMFDNNLENINKIDVSKFEICDSDGCGVAGDNEDNDGEVDNKNCNQNVPRDGDVSHEVGLSETHVINDDVNIDKLKTLKATVKSIRSFFLSSGEVDESTRKSLEEKLENSEKQLKSLKPSNSIQQKKKSRFLKEIKEMKMTLQKKCYDSSDEEGNVVSVIYQSATENEHNEIVQNVFMLDQKFHKNYKENSDNTSSYITVDDNNREQFAALHTNLLLTTEKLSEIFNGTLNMIFYISKTGSSSRVDLNTVTQNIKDMQRYFNYIIELLSINKTNTISNHYLIESQAKATDNDVFGTHAQLRDSHYSNNEVPIADSSKEKHNNKALSQDEEINGNILRGRSSSDLFKADKKVEGSGKGEAASSFVECSTNNCKVPFSANTQFRQSSSADELIRTKNIHMRDADQYKFECSKRQLISMRNIDRSQLSFADINLDALVKTVQTTNTISTQNIDLSQLVSNASESSLLESHHANYDGNEILHPGDTLHLTTNDSLPETGIFISFSPKSQVSSKKEFHQSSSVDELETLRKPHTPDELSIHKDEHKIVESTKVSARNIDLSRLTSFDFNLDPVGKLNLNTNSISVRNIDLSQLVSRESDSSLLESHQGNHRDRDDKMSYTMDTLQLTVNDSSPEDGIFISFSPKHKHAESTYSESYNLRSSSVEDCNDPLINCSSVNYNQNQQRVVSENDNVALDAKNHATIILTIECAEKKLEVLKEKIMDFVGLKTNDLYNEFDEELVQIMMTIDCLQLNEFEPLKSKRDNIVQDICKYSILLERKHLDHEFLDEFEKEVTLVENEMRQSLANQKLQNLQNIASDVADMISEMENKVVDHLLIERRENCVKRLESIKDNLNIFVR